jgi:hypothetical protein
MTTSLVYPPASRWEIYSNEIYRLIFLGHEESVCHAFCGVKIGLVYHRKVEVQIDIAVENKGDKIVRGARGCFWVTKKVEEWFCVEISNK